MFPVAKAQNDVWVFYVKNDEMRQPNVTEITLPFRVMPSPKSNHYQPSCSNLTIIKVSPHNHPPAAPLAPHPMLSYIAPASSRINRHPSKNPSPQSVISNAAYRVSPRQSHAQIPTSCAPALRVRLTRAPANCKIIKNAERRAIN